MAPARACAVLGIEPTASRETIEKAYRAKALQCHPDKAAHLDDEIRALAESKFKELTAAYECLLGE